MMTHLLATVPWGRLLAYLLLSTVVLGNLATWLRRRHGWRDGYTRKVNHFGHMVISTPLLAFLPPEQLLPAVAIGAVAVVIVYAIAATSSHPLVHGIVAGSLRERDQPRSRFFFFMPLVAGNLGLVLAAFVYPIELVRVAFFTVAFADGFAEPVGLRFGGNNRFSVGDPIWRCRNQKSIAGCCTVFLWSLAIAATLLGLAHGASGATMAIAFAYAAIVTLIEALSPRGMDNMLLFVLCPLALLALGAQA
jgi:dolichol kinase